MSEGQFTMADAEDDGLIKREAGSQMVSVAKRESPELWEHFVNVCESRGRDPSDVLGGLALRALEDMEFAKSMSRKQIDMSVLRRDEIRKDDVQYVKELANELGMDEDNKDPIMELVEQRIQGVSQSPISGLRPNENAEEGDSERVVQHLEKLNRRIDQIESKVGDGEGEPEGGSSQTTDDLMDSISDGDGGDTTVEVRDVSEGSEQGGVLSSEEGVKE